MYRLQLDGKAIIAARATDEKHRVRERDTPG
jgi:hypothetical protein